MTKSVKMIVRPAKPKVALASSLFVLFGQSNQMPQLIPVF